MSSLTLLAKAESLLAKDQWPGAHSLLVRALRISTDPFLKAEILQKDAEALRALGRFREALAGYRSAEILYRKLNVPSERLQTIFGVSACLRILGRYKEAGRLWAKWEPNALIRSASTLSEIELERALVARGQGHFSEARRRMARALSRLSRRKDAGALQHAHWILGGLERFSGRFPEALKAFDQAVRLARRTKDLSSEAFALCGLAGVQRVVGRDRASLANYAEAHRILSKIGDPFGQAYGLCGRANALRVFGDAAKTVPLYRQSAALYRRLGDASSEGFAEWGLGGSFRRLGRFPESLAAYRRALALFKKSKDDRGMVMAHLGLARWAEASGREQEACFSAARGLSEARRARLPYETALARYEMGRMRRPARPPYALLRSFGLTPAVLRRWWDIP
jgi:tetratricopeptide (TPR) repeat protein